MRNLPKLIHTILRVYERPEFKPQIENGVVIKTHCNEAVRDVLGSFNYHKFSGMTADQIIEFLDRSSDWKRVEMKDVQFMVNQGSIVIAGLSSVDIGIAHNHPENHGHVCIIRPGEELWSNKWQCMVPACMNIGGQNFILHYESKASGRIEAGVNGAFPSIPIFYAWIDSL